MKYFVHGYAPDVLQMYALKRIKLNGPQIVGGFSLGGRDSSAIILGTKLLKLIGWKLETLGYSEGRNSGPTPTVLLRSIKLQTALVWLLILEFLLLPFSAGSEDSSHKKNCLLSMRLCALKKKKKKRMPEMLGFRGSQQETLLLCCKNLCWHFSCKVSC